MTDHTLTSEELVQLIHRVFEPRPDERGIAVLVDLPDDNLPDDDAWRTRRQLAAGWVGALQKSEKDHGLLAQLYCYRHVTTNNADLPVTAFAVDAEALPRSAADLPADRAIPLDVVLADHPMALAPTELSATAPLKMMAPRLGFRAATMPGFSPAMIPALRLDYGEVNRRVWWLKEVLDRAVRCDILFQVDENEVMELILDLRHRTAHASGGLLPTPGTAGNLPSGEAYIVPYEGEVEGDPTATAGRLPIQFGDEVVVFRIEDNSAVEILSAGPASDDALAALVAEPASGNVAELGLGVLSDFGLEPIGEVLLDEKLGLHIAFGRSEHFGGQVGPQQFSRPEAVIHQDHVYLPELQPRVVPMLVTLSFDDGSEDVLMRDGRYVVDFDNQT